MGQHLPLIQKEHGEALTTLLSSLNTLLSCPPPELRFLFLPAPVSCEAAGRRPATLAASPAPIDGHSLCQ